MKNVMNGVCSSEQVAERKHQGMFQEQDVGTYQRKGVEVTAFSLFWNVDTHIETIPKVFSHSPLHRLLLPLLSPTQTRRYTHTFSN